MDIDVLRALSNQIARVAMELKPLNDNLRRLNITNAENATLREVVADGELHAREILAENAKLRELVARMAKALDVNSMWCNADCNREFNCDMSDCPIDAALQELGIEVPDA